MRTLFLSGASLALTACAHITDGKRGHDAFTLDDEGDFIEAVYLPDATEARPLSAEPLPPLTMPGQLKPLPSAEDEAAPLKPYQAIDRANASAAVEPDAGAFVNAIQIYPYTIGSLYQVYCAPGQVTDITLQPGEELVSVSAGDTVRWILGDTVSGSATGEQVHILVKPIAPKLSTNLIVATTKRTYHIEMRSFRETYMAAVSWRYPAETMTRRSAKPAGQRARQIAIADRGIRPDRLRFRYEIEGDDPHWRPVRAFDDGRKVYIQFPARLDQGEAPPLFVIGRKGESQLVNYRVEGNTYVVDRLFGVAELRLGEDDQEVVRIVRTEEETGDRRITAIARSGT